MPTLQQQIAARLHQAAEHRHAAGFEIPFAALHVDDGIGRKEYVS